LPVLSWRRLFTVGLICLLLSGLLFLGWKASYALLISRLLIVGLVALLAFSALERWPARLPSWLARWMLQLVAVAIVVVPSVMLAYSLTTIGLDPPWWRHGDRLAGFVMITAVSLLVAPWVAISALMQQIRGAAQRQALQFELERSEYERQATGARLRLLQAQVEPHFLFNTLANVRELVDSGSPQASAVLGSLIAYLRAAVPRLHDPSSTLRQELELVRSYLEVMHMRMPDRLRFSLHVEPAALECSCPSSALLTLVENAVRHGVDPSERGGEIEVRADEREGRCRVVVADTGVGLRQGIAGLGDGTGLGTGLSTLRERLQLAFGGDAQLRLVANQPRGARAELEFPARRGTP
jgi:signal transduction histidine kinase